LHEEIVGGSYTTSFAFFECPEVMPTFSREAGKKALLA